MAKLPIGGGTTVKPVKPVQTKPPVSNPQPTAQSSQPPQTNPYDYNSDPVLQRINAWAIQQNANIEATALNSRNQALINYGFDPAQDSLYDANTKQAAQQNPFSVLANLAHQHTITQHNLNENLNKANLWYSGYRGQQLNEDERNYLGQQYGAGQDLLHNLSGIETNRVNQEQGVQGQVAQGNTDAYDRALAFGNQYGYPTAGSTGAGPGGKAAVSGIPRASKILSNLATRRIGGH